MSLSDIYKKIYPLYIYNRRKMRKKIKNKDFTLITPNCTAGIIYHDLGLEFLSPTINLNILNFDKFLLNMDYYLAQELVFVKSDYTFPVATLGGDVTIWFTHYNSSEEAAKKWNERKGRINKDNLYILCSDIDLDTPEKIRRVVDSKQYKKIKVFTAKNYDIEDTIYIEKFNGQPHVGNLISIDALRGVRGYERYLDVVKWLNDD